MLVKTFVYSGAVLVLSGVLSSVMLVKTIVNCVETWCINWSNSGVKRCTIVKFIG